VDFDSELAVLGARSLLHVVGGAAFFEGAAGEAAWAAGLCFAAGLPANAAAGASSSAVTANTKGARAFTSAP